MVTEDNDLSPGAPASDDPPAILRERVTEPGDEDTTSTADATPATEEAAAPEPIEGLIMGSTVHYVLDQPYGAGEAPVIRPATIVHVWDTISGCVNLQVFTDGSNDRKFTGIDARRFPGDTGPGTVWKSSRLYSEGREPGTWHWPPRG